MPYRLSYPDNYIDFFDKTYDQYLNQSLQEQENQIIQALVDETDPCRSEFFNTHPLGILNSFSSFGCATGVLKKINFSQIRAYLLALIANCRVGVWYRTASLIAYLKRHNPFFLISDKMPCKKSEYTPDRYHNFHEATPEDHFTRTRIRENSKDRFERVEGRYVDRFLEGIPLALGYVNVAYSDEKDTVYPSIDKLQAFRITDRGALALNRAIKEADITLLPNYEIHIDSLFYPARRLHRLLGLCDVVQEDTHIVRQPKKLFDHLAQAQKVPAYVKHSDWAFKSLGDTVQSRFAAQKHAKKKAPARKDDSHLSVPSI